VTVGLLTGNIREGARAKLTHYDLWRQFVFGGFGDEHYERDEVARVALAAVHAHLNGSVSPDRVWVIGDTPLDVRCARAIGAKAVAVATGWHTFQQLEMTSPDLLIRDFSDAEPFLRMLQTLPPP
jgi:phosphoglycolate phosphatase-like HAD superfamily hydrolase